MTPSTYLKRLPWSILICAMALMGVGLTGIARGDELAGGGTHFARQLVWVTLAIPVCLLATVVPYRRLKGVAWPLYLLSLLLLVMVYFMPSRHGSHRRCFRKL